MPTTARIRPATPADRAGIESLCREQFDAADFAGVPLLLDDPRFGPEAFWVAEDAGTIVSCLSLLSMTLSVGDIEVPVGLPEYIATAASHRHQGLVRQQVDAAHERSQARGDLLQLIGGIPYYYRRFGYGWGIGMPGGWRLRSNGLPTVGDDVQVRPVTVDDLSAVVPLHRDLARRADVRTERTHEEWEAHLRLAGEDRHLLAVERGGDVTGAATCHVTSTSARLSDISASSIEDVTALARYGLERGNGDLNLIDRPRTPVEAWGRSHGVRATDEIWAWYVRIPDPVALLDHLRPVLTSRLQASPYAAHRGEVPFSTYVEGFTLHVEDGAVVGVEPRAPEIDPGGDTVGIAPDLLPGLLFGRRGALVEQALHPDVLLGTHAGIVDVLFPNQVADVTLWY